MNEEIYEKLADALDRLPNGFPRTPSNVEIPMLKKKFSNGVKEDNLMKERPLVILFLLIVIAGCQRSTWREFNLSEGGFSIVMPGKPSKQIVKTNSAIGPIDFFLLTLEQEDVVYMVGYSDYPDTFLQSNTQDSLLDIACYGAVVNLKGNLVSRSVISINEHPGREMKIEQANGKTIYLTRLFLVGRRLYQVTVLTLKRKEISNDDKKFLDSFTLLEK